MAERLIKGLIECFIYTFFVGIIIFGVFMIVFSKLKDYGIDINKPVYIQIIIKNDTLDFKTTKHE